MTTKRYVVLPPYGFRSPALAQAASLTPRAAPIGNVLQRIDGDGRSLQVLDMIGVDGPRLVEMTPDAELELRREEPRLKIVPVVTYHTMRLRQEVLRDPIGALTVRPEAGVQLRVVTEAGEPIAGAVVVAFTNFRTRAGGQGVTGADGTVRLGIKNGSAAERLYVYGPAGYWGRFERGFAMERGASVTLKAIDLNDPSLALTRFRQALPLAAGADVVVGIVDTGIARDHPSLPNIAGGANMVLDETQDEPGLVEDWGPARSESGDHGTHVAGIVGARASAAGPLTGVAPNVTLRSYRVFPHAGGGATNYDIMNAIDRAVQDGCHIVNLSLGGGEEDEAVRAAIGSAADRGVLVVAAAGNDGRKPVSFPAALPACVAVSAMGWTDTFPSGSSETGDIAQPHGKADRRAFVAAFSNFGPQIDLTGPGVGMVSTLPGGGFGAMSGTSMACPAVAGYAAFLLGDDEPILRTVGSDRVALLLDRLYKSARELGFGRDYEGFGLPG